MSFVRDLQFAGISLKFKQPCPHCSYRRSKPNDPCMTVEATDAGLSCFCWHCKADTIIKIEVVEIRL